MKTLFQRKEDCLLLIAFASLKQWGESTDPNNLFAEKSRLDRIISEAFCKSTSDMDYNQFVLDFIKQHGREIVYENNYTYDTPIQDDYTELNIEMIIDRYNKKKT